MGRTRISPAGGLVWRTVWRDSTSGRRLPGLLLDDGVVDGFGVPHTLRRWVWGRMYVRSVGLGGGLCKLVAACVDHIHEFSTVGVSADMGDVACRKLRADTQLCPVFLCVWSCVCSSLCTDLDTRTSPAA